MVRKHEISWNDIRQPRAKGKPGNCSICMRHWVHIMVGHATAHFLAPHWGEIENFS